MQANHRLVEKLEGEYDALIEQLRDSAAVYADETSWWVGESASGSGRCGHFGVLAAFWHSTSGDSKNQATPCPGTVAACCRFFGGIESRTSAQTQLHELSDRRRDVSRQIGRGKVVRDLDRIGRLENPVGHE